MIRVHTDTRQDADGYWWIDVFLNGSPCGILGPIAVEETADLFAQGVGEGIGLAIERAQKRGKR